MDSHPSTPGGKPVSIGPAESHPVESLFSDVTIPDHQLLRLIGRGSYGEVWLVRNMMGVYRAVKIVHRDTFEDQRPFEREWSGICSFEPISRSHESFIDVLHVGMNEDEGYFYYVMELGDDARTGQTVDPATYSPKTLSKEMARRGKLPFDECLQLGLALTQALNELHKRNLVHRDIKPSNIIFVNEVPKLADIGLVAGMGEARSYVGTEGFIPPEGPGTPQADVFSLGKVLYELCTGKDRHDFPELPTLLNEFPDTRKFLELNEVILKACSNQIGERYQSAWEMHADLLVLANGGSVKRLKILERKFATLKRMLAFAGVAVVTLSLLSYPVYLKWRNAVEARERQVSASVFRGNRAIESGDLVGALPHFTEALQLDQRNSLEEPTHRLRIGATLSRIPKLTQFWNMVRGINGLAVTPDGRHLLFTEERGGGYRYDLETGEERPTPLKGLASLHSVHCSPDGNWFLAVSAGSNQAVQIWNGEGIETGMLVHPSQVRSVTFSPDGLRVATGASDGLLRLWNTRSGILEKELTPPGANSILNAVGFSHDGKMLVTGQVNGMVWLWDAVEGRSVQSFRHDNMITAVVFSPDDRMIVTACMDFRARAWRLDGTRVLPDMTHRAGVMALSFSPDGRWVATGSIDGTARFWQADSFEPVPAHPILRHSDPVLGVLFDPGGRRLITACVDGTVRVWDLAGNAIAPKALPYSVASYDGSRLLALAENRVKVGDAKTGKELSSWNVEVSGVRLTRDGRFVYCVRPGGDSTNRVLQVWEADTGRPRVAGLALPSFGLQAVLSPDGTRAFLFGQSQGQMWDLTRGEPISAVLEHPDSVRGAIFSLDGMKVAVRCGTRLVVWGVDGQEVFPPLEHLVPVAYAEFDPDHLRIVAACRDPTLNRGYAQVWDAVTGKRIGFPLKHRDGVGFACFSPDGRRVLTISEDFTAMVWDAATGRQVSAPLQHDAQVHSAAFSPDSRWVATGGMDQTVRLWNAETGDPLGPPLRDHDAISRVRFLPDGSGVVSVTAGRLVRTWMLNLDTRPAEDLIALAQFISGRSAIPLNAWGDAEPEPLENLWLRLRASYPATFTVASTDAAAWHEAQAESCELQRNWFAARFHLHRLQALQPGSPNLADRLERVARLLNEAPR